MVPAPWLRTVSVPPPSSQRGQRAHRSALHLTALTLVTTLPLLPLCALAVQLAHRRCPPPLPRGPGGAPRTDAEASLLLIALLRTLWRFSSQDMHDWLVAWPARARACGLPMGETGQYRVPSASQQCKRLVAAGAPPYEVRCILMVGEVLCRGVSRARDLSIDSAPILAWQRTDPNAAFGHAPAHHATPLLRGFRVHTLWCRGSGLPLFFIVTPAPAHDAPFARLLLAGVVQLYALQPRVVRLDAAYWGLSLIRWIHAVLGAVAVIPWNPKRQRNRFCLPPTWTREALGKRGSIERFFERVFRFFGWQRPPVVGWTAVVQRAALTDTATLVVALAAHEAGRADLIRSPKRVLAHLWEGDRMS